MNPSSGRAPQGGNPAAASLWDDRGKTPGGACSTNLKSGRDFQSQGRYFQLVNRESRALAR